MVQPATGTKDSLALALPIVGSHLALRLSEMKIIFGAISVLKIVLFFLLVDIALSYTLAVVTGKPLKRVI